MAAAQVLSNECVSSKIRLNIVNALRIVMDGGADARADQIVGLGGLFVGFDPVAVDTQALSALLRERRASGMAQPIPTACLDEATRLGLGRRQIDELQRILIDRGS